MAISLAIEAAINAKWGGVNSNNHAAQTAGVAFIIVSFSTLSNSWILITTGPDFWLALLQRQFWSGLLGVSKRDVRRLSRSGSTIANGITITVSLCESAQLERRSAHAQTVGVLPSLPSALVDKFTPGACNVLISQVSPIGMSRLQYSKRGIYVKDNC